KKPPVTLEDAQLWSLAPSVISFTTLGYLACCWLVLLAMLLALAMVFGGVRISRGLPAHC
ncbi:MAG: hypothetical protein ACKPJD_01575, partial [Planctomycetaceae bacterium]